jgi:hypothetical protein
MDIPAMTQFVVSRHIVFNDIMGSTFIFNISLRAQPSSLTFFGEQASRTRPVRRRTGGPTQAKASKV